MNLLVYLVVNVACVLIDALQLLMLVRAILSWIPMMDESAFTEFIYRVTEIPIYPVRRLLERSEAVASMPLDIPFFVTFVLLSVIRMLLM